MMFVRSRSGFLAPWMVLTWSTLVAMIYQWITGRRILPGIGLLPILGAELLTLILWALYWMWLYPAYLTPFHHLPTPPRRWFFTGNRPTWFPPNRHIVLSQLIRSVESDGIMRFYGPTNLERLVVTSPEGLKDILVTNMEDFDHHTLVKLGLKRITGSNLADVGHDEMRVFSITPNNIPGKYLYSNIASIKVT